MELNAVIMFITCIICLFIFGKIFIWPLKNILKLVFNSILGGILIYIINLIGMNFGFHIGLNLVTATTVGVLGVPGAILLVILKIILRIEIHITKIKGKNFKSFPLEKNICIYSTVTDFARFLGLSTSKPFCFEI